MTEPTTEPTTGPTTGPATGPRAGAVDRREIVRLAMPAFLALVAEPLFLLADSAIIGHLGTGELAGLGVAGAVLLTAAGVFVFLAYATTAAVARLLGAGRPDQALAAGLDGLWLSLLLGAGATALVAAAADPLAGVFGASPQAHGHAVTYLRVAALGLPGMLAVLALTGVLRGLLDTRTPLVAAVAGFSVNVVLNLLFVHGLHWGIAGSAWGTVIAQTGMAAGLAAVVLRRAAARRVPLRPHPGRVLAAGRHGIPLVVRTVALRGAILLTVWAAAGLGDAPLAAHQIVATLWSFLAFALDALAIAGQAVVGRDLGAGRADRARAAARTVLRWGAAYGIVLGGLTVLAREPLTRLFSPDPQVVRYAAAALVVVGLGQVVSGYVFVADGVLMGAGDFGYLARAMLGALVAYLPLVLVVRSLGPPAGTGLVWLWLAFTAFLLVRAVTLWWRLRGSAWAVTGAAERAG